MVTLGFLQEVYYLAKSLNYTHNVIISGPSKHAIALKVTPEGVLDVYYGSNYIWSEKMDGEESYLGVESMDSISRCIANIDNGSNWKDYAYFQK